MKTKFLKYGVLGIAAMVCGLTAQAQTTKASASKSNKSSAEHSDYTRSSYNTDDNGHSVERIETTINGKEFKVKLENDKITSLYVDDEKVAPADYGKYETEITEIREQIKRD